MDFHMNRLLSVSYDGGGHDEKPNGDALNIKVDKLTGLSVLIFSIQYVAEDFMGVQLHPRVDMINQRL